MISYISNYLTNKGYIASTENTPVNIYVGRCTLLEFYLVDSSIAVKVAESNTLLAQSLYREYLALEENAKLYAKYMPKIIDYNQNKKYTMIIMVGLDFLPASLDDLMTLNGQERFEFQAIISGIARKTTLRNNMHERVSTAIRKLPNKARNTIEALSLKRKWQKVLEQLQPIPQHGDLAINNIARTPGNLVIFDWEDFGLIDIPCFDLCILLLSVCDFEYKKVSQMVNDITSNDNHFFSQILSQLNISREYLLDFILIHSILFRDLKTNLDYGTEICKKVLTLIEDISTKTQ